jgi:hypothetical protein
MNVCAIDRKLSVSGDDARQVSLNLNKIKLNNLINAN